MKVAHRRTKSKPAEAVLPVNALARPIILNGESGNRRNWVADGASVRRQPIGKRVFLGTGSRNVSCDETDLLRTGRLLHTAGLRVCTRFYDAGHELSADMLTEVNRWVMAEMYATATGS
jgi:hypothetical protein